MSATKTYAHSKTHKVVLTDYQNDEKAARGALQRMSWAFQSDIRKNGVDGSNVTGEEIRNDDGELIAVTQTVSYNE
jgi:hypothetical protein